MEDRTAEVVPLYPARSCFECAHFTERDDPDDPASGVYSYCTVYQEVIDSEAYSAEDCPAYERVTVLHEIRLERAGDQTAVSCACGVHFGLFPPGEGQWHISVFKEHKEQACAGL